MTAAVDEVRRQQEEAAWGEVAPTPRRQRVTAAEKLQRGQREEVRGLTGPPGRKAKFVKITPGVHVQTRGPMVLFCPMGEKGSRRPDRGWFVVRLRGDSRLRWDDQRSDILLRLSRSEQLAGPYPGMHGGKKEARRIIVAANGELGS